MLCESCKTRPAARISTRILNGEKQVTYRCEVCEALAESGSKPRLERPCERCGEKEGRIKLTRLAERYRTVTYLCETCAART
ncbi:MAG: hypothetical protein OXU79_16645 [Gemmatimonadota bacterium]|nr:hypothetical protein [Gemmatimonadota bacterium]